MTTLIKGLKKPITRLISRHNIAEVLNPLKDLCNTIHNFLWLQPIYFTRRSYNIKLYLIKNTRTRHCMHGSIFNISFQKKLQVFVTNSNVLILISVQSHGTPFIIRNYIIWKTWMFATMGGKDLWINIRVWWQQFLRLYTLVLVYIIKTKWKLVLSCFREEK